MAKNVREKILKILVKPTTITELKNKIKEVRSFGTLVYHLKELDREGIITKKLKDKPGDAITYELTSKKVLNRINESRNQEERRKIAFLKYIKENENVEDAVMINDLKNLGYDEDLIGDSSLSCVGDNLSIVSHKITEKGKKFLADNK